MEEKQRLEEFKLPNSVVSASCRLLPFFSKNSNTHMSSQDHGHVICSITNGQSSLLRVLLPDHLHNLSFLFWRNTAGKDNINIIGNTKENF